MYEADNIRAYGIVQRHTGSVMQIGILPEWRGRIDVSSVIDALAAQTDAATLRFVNVEDRSWMAHSLEQLGWTAFVYQYEMTRQI
ncbi:MAG: hypothetical protein RLY87_1699 [Chloroflexota bacterium]